MSWTHPYPKLRGLTGGRGRRQSQVAEALAGGGVHLLHRVSYLDSTSSASTGPEADAGPLDAAAERSGSPMEQGTEPDAAGWVSWPVEPGRATAAMRQARAYRSPAFEDDAEGAWSARVDAAVQGMDEVDPAGLDGWMQVHASSRVPHLYEARLVAAWETRQHHDVHSSGAATQREELAASEVPEHLGADDGDAWD